MEIFYQNRGKGAERKETIIARPDDPGVAVEKLLSDFFFQSRYTRKKRQPTAQEKGRKT